MLQLCNRAIFIDNIAHNEYNINVPSVLITKGIFAMIITATELKANIGKYLQLAETEDIIVTKNNKPIVKLTGMRENKLEILDSLVGIIEDDGYTLEDARRDRLARQ